MCGVCECVYVCMDRYLCIVVYVCAHVRMRCNASVRACVREGEYVYFINAILEVVCVRARGCLFVSACN